MRVGGTLTADDEPDDKALQAETIRSLLARDKKLTELFVREHSGWMLLLARRIMVDAALAEDVVQNAFSNIFRGLPDFDGRSSLKTWMHRIVVNQALMELRKSKRQQERSIDDLLPRFDNRGCRIEELPEFSEQTPTPESLLLSAEDKAMVLACIDELPEGYRLVLLLRDIEELTTHEVADVTGLTEANVKVRLHRARAALKKLLSPLFRGGQQ